MSKIHKTHFQVGEMPWKRGGKARIAWDIWNDFMIEKLRLREEEGKLITFKRYLMSNYPEFRAWIEEN